MADNNPYRPPAIETPSESDRAIPARDGAEKLAIVVVVVTCFPSAVIALIVVARFLLGMLAA